MIRRVRAKRWCFTINNYREAEIQLVHNITDLCSCIICEKEVAESGTPHLQGYAEFINRIDGGRVRALLGGRAHLEVARGSRADNIKYCSKAGTEAIIVSKIPDNVREATVGEKIQATFKLLMDIREMNQEEFEANHPAFFLNHRNKYYEHRHDALVRKHETWNGELKKKNFWIWGEAGVGKSRMARKGVEHYRIFSKPFNKWWNGFDSENTVRVIIDDWPDMDHGGDMLCQHLKVWADRYPFTGEVKGSHIAIMPKYQLIITSNYSIDECFKNEEDRKAIKRRMTEFNMLGNGTLDSELQLPNPDEEEEEEEREEESTSSYEDSIVEE